MSTNIRKSTHVNEKRVDAMRNEKIRAACSVLGRPALGPTTATGSVYGSSRAAIRSNSGSDINVDVLPKHIGRGPHGSFEWDHNISPQRGPYKDDPHGHVNNYFGQLKPAEINTAEYNKMSLTSKPSEGLKMGISPVTVPSQQMQTNIDQKNALSPSSK